MENTCDKGPFYNEVSGQIHGLIPSIRTSTCYKVTDQTKIIGFSHLSEHKFQNNFDDILNLLCSCDIDAKTNFHLFLCCQFFNAIRETQMIDLKVH